MSVTNVISNFENARTCNENIFIMFVTIKQSENSMASILLKKLSDELHREVKRLQLTYEEDGRNKSLEEIYIELIEKGLKQVKKETPTK